ncbi:hypothetical protein H6G00_22420 [Leptolyngbya sp. FACHB-541]|uniref:hypothetical protein n=1 Tax=Leptolyngbya sp. FACHB-541 TaxID=2692810 RepID=UPI00168563A7|nr:hypothetical protein [Leptolyngbya sp. FACHB-541]MBD1999331.1 hypothetical protein [Leptolyngbya sp. FACHB-541]MBD1999333.1 hypothetical protein [Leptolyngbya sp. FACHB-541]
MFPKLIRTLSVSVVLAAPVVALIAESTLAAQYLTIWNNNDLAIVDLYVSSSNSSYWGRDRLGSSVLEQDQDTSITISGNSCVYDVKAVYEDGTYDTGAVDFCNGGGSIEFFGYGGNNY